MRLHEIMNEDVDPIKARFRNFEPEDWQTLYSKFTNAEQFADRVIDSTSPRAESMRRAVMQTWTAWNANPKAPRDPLGNLSGLKKEIAKAIGATEWRPAREVPWGDEMMSGPDCYVFDTPRGGVFLDASVIKREVWMSQISTENRSSGLGTSVMDAIREYAVQHGLGVKVFKVTNRNFFDKFNWLRRDGDSYIAPP
jgi:hypothetical protein